MKTLVQHCSAVQQKDRARGSRRWIPALIAAVMVASCRDPIAPPLPLGATYVVAVSPAAAGLAAGTIVEVKAQLVDAAGTRVQVAGRKVTWTNTNGTGQPRISITDAGGGATTTLVLGTVAGVSYQLHVLDDAGMSGESDRFISVAGPPVQYLVTTTPVVVTVGQTIGVSAQLTDQYRNSVAIAGRLVTWTRTDSAGGGAASIATSTTDAHGVATAAAAMGLVVQKLWIQVSDDHSITGSSPITPGPGAAAVYVVGIDPREVNAPAGSEVTVIAQPADANGNRIFGVVRAVEWTVAGSGAALSRVASAVEADGTARVTLITSNVPGETYSVSATDSTGMHGSSAPITTGPQVSLSSLATGFASSSACGTSATGELWCWGDNGFGQLGNGTTVSRYLPGRGAPNLSFASVAVGTTFACGLTSSGAAYCWGHNTNGQLGDNSQTAHALPAPVATSVAFVSLSAGASHACGVAMNGDGYCWGANQSGQVGVPNAGAVALAPVKVGALSFVAISAGGDYTCGITTNSSAYCWGLNSQGQIGDGSTITRTTPVPVAGIQFAALTTGLGHTCGISLGGTAFCWGDNTRGQLGIAKWNGGQFTPAAVAGNLAFTTIAAGSSHTCAISTAGLAYCWGDNNQGELGNGGQIPTNQPVAVAGGLQFKTISASSAVSSGSGYYDYYYDIPISAHTCGVTVGGAAYCWGSPDMGQLGLGLQAAAVTMTPAKVAGQH